MFIRQLTRREGNRAYALPEGGRKGLEKGKTQQRTLVNFGHISHWSPDKVQWLIEELQAIFDLTRSTRLRRDDHAQSSLGTHSDRRFLTIVSGGEDGWPAHRSHGILPVNGVTDVVIADLTTTIELSP